MYTTDTTCITPSSWKIRFDNYYNCCFSTYISSWRLHTPFLHYVMYSANFKSNYKEQVCQVIAIIKIALEI